MIRSDSSIKNPNFEINEKKLNSILWAIMEQGNNEMIRQLGFGGEDDRKGELKRDITNATKTLFSRFALKVEYMICYDLGCKQMISGIEKWIIII